MTDTDTECEALILSAIQNNFPDHNFIGEEGSAAQACFCTPLLWVLLALVLVVIYANLHLH